MAGIGLHIKEIREKIVALIVADFTSLYSTAGYVVSDREKVILPSTTTVFVEFKGAGPVKKAIRLRSWRYEFHIFVGVLKADPDQAQDAMDTLLSRTIISLGAHPKLDAYTMTTPAEEVFNCYLGREGDGDTVAPYRGTIHGSNKYFQIVRLRFFVETEQSGV